jgi:hypothetical protein
VSDPLPDYETLREILALVGDVVLLVGADRKVWFVNRLDAGYDAGRPAEGLRQPAER